MLNSRSFILMPLLVVGCLWSIREYQNWATARSNTIAGPDVIVGDLYEMTRWGTASGKTAFTVGTISCNIGTAQLAWFASTPQHPVISQNMYRVKNGRIEMIGMSWLKHGFTALQQNLCSTCQSSGSGSWLGIGCSDPYSAGLNASQGSSGLGPRRDVNATTGVFPYPPSARASTTSLLNGRIQVDNTDLDPALNPVPGTRYFVESMYVASDDAAAGNGLNNASYREAFRSNVTGGWDIDVNGTATTKRQEPGINAWKLVHSDVRLFNVDVPGDGRIIVGVRTTPISGGYHTEIAVENLNSHQSVRSLGATFGSSNVTNPGFRDVDYYLEAYSGTDWTPVLTQNEMKWSTEAFTTNANANALRWSTLYSFWCDSALPPTKLTLGMFRPGTVSEMTVNLVQPVASTSTQMTDGVQISGTSADVNTSNDQYWKMAGGPKALPLADRSVVTTLQGTSPASNPADMAFRLEAFFEGQGPVGDVIQQVELFNFVTNAYELVDQRAAVNTEQALAIYPTGDRTRFIQTGTNQVRARLKWSTPNGFSVTRFAWFIKIDEAVWLFPN